MSQRHFRSSRDHTAWPITCRPPDCPHASHLPPFVLHTHRQPSGLCIMLLPPWQSPDTALTHSPTSHLCSTGTPVSHCCPPLPSSRPRKKGWERAERESEPGSQARKGKSIRGKREGDWLLRSINVLPFWQSPPYTNEEFSAGMVM